MANAVRQDADVVLRITPATFPVVTAAGEAFDLAAWLRQSEAAQQECQGQCVHDTQRYAVRVLAARLPPEAAARARQRKYKQAQKHGRTSSEATLALADWVVVATTLAADWSLHGVLRLYRARWQVELFHKTVKQHLGFEDVATSGFDSVISHVHWVYCAYILLCMSPPGVSVGVKSLGDQQRPLQQLLENQEKRRVLQKLSQIGGVQRYKDGLRQALADA